MRGRETSRRASMWLAAMHGRVAVYSRLALVFEWAVIGSGALFLWLLCSLLQGGIQ